MKSSVIDQMRNLDQYHHSTQNAVNRKNATKNRAKNVAKKIKIAKNAEIIRNADAKIKIKCAINKPVNVKMDSLEIGAVCAFHWRMPTWMVHVYAPIHAHSIQIWHGNASTNATREHVTISIHFHTRDAKRHAQSLAAIAVPTKIFGGMVQHACQVPCA